MPSFKISQLSELTTADDADFFEIVDDSELTISDKNKRITFDNLKLSIYSDSRIDTAFPAWNVATTYDSANNPQYVSYQSRLYQFTKSSGTDTGTTPGTDITVWDAVGGVKFFAPPATDAEAAAKTATNRYLTPANLAASGVVDTLYSVDGSLTSNRTVTLGTYTLDINLDSTGTFAIQDAGTDVFTVNASGNVNVQNNELYFGGSKFLSTPNGNVLLGKNAGAALSSIRNVIIGENAIDTETLGTENVFIGFTAKSANSVNYSTGLGYGVNIGHSGSIALGWSAKTTAEKQFIVGSNTVTITKAIFGAGTGGAFDDHFTLQSSNNDNSASNATSGNFTIQSGHSIGNQDGGSIIFKASQAGASGSGINAQTTFLTIDPSTGVDIENNELYFGGELVLKTEGTENLFLGKSQLNLPSGSYNTIIGDRSGGTVSLTGSENTLLGNNVELRGDYSNTIGIGADISVEASSGIIIASGTSGSNKPSVKHNSIVLATPSSATTTNDSQFVTNMSEFIMGGNPNDSTGSSSPIIIRNQDRITGTNLTSASVTIQSGQSTGSADGGNLIFKVSDGGASGTAQNSQSTVFELGASSIGMYGVTPTTRATTGIGAATFTANTSGISDDTATWGGYTIGQVVQALQTIGILT